MGFCGTLGGIGAAGGAGAGGAAVGWGSGWAVGGASTGAGAAAAGGALYEGAVEAEPDVPSLEDSGRLRSMLMVNATSTTPKSTTPASVHRTGRPLRFGAGDCRTSGADGPGA